MDWRGCQYVVDLAGLREQLAIIMALQEYSMQQVAELAGLDRVTLWRFLFRGQQIRERNARAIVLKSLQACWHDHVFRLGGERPSSRCASCPLRGEPFCPFPREARIVSLPNLDDTSRIDVSSPQLVANAPIAIGR